MSHYCITSSSNYFKVKDIDKFREVMLDLNINLFKTKNGIMISMDEDLNWPSFSYDEENNETEIDLVKIIYPYLIDDSVAVLFSTGSDIGEAVAFNNKGEIKSININDIYKLAESLGNDITKWGEF